MIKPTEQAYDELQDAYDFFNDRLFDGRLPQCLMTLQREKQSYGYFSQERWESREAAITDEIALNPVYFEFANPEDALSTLVHEMVHLWQQHFGKPGRGRYHNKQWAAKMKDLGLYPSATGQVGGSETGDQMSHYVIVEGPFATSCATLLAADFTLSWRDPFAEETGGTKSNRQKYTCPECGLNAWAKPNVALLCGECQQAMK